MKRDFLSMMDAADRLDALVDAGVAWSKKGVGLVTSDLAGRTLALLFEKPSTRTRVSFEVAMIELGGQPLYLSAQDLQLGRGETVEDTARVLSRYVAGIAYRAFSHETMRALASSAEVPVINALDDLEHPCQVLADLVTIKAHLGGCPVGYKPNPNVVGLAEAQAREKGGTVAVVVNPEEAVADADVVYTDVWISMGDEAEETERVEIFQPYRVTSELMAGAKDDALFMHCLPAHRGMEVTNEVIDSPQSVVFDQAENRLHAQKALLVDLLG